jgi:nucleotide-binding universal stress UspA family protein
MSVVAVLTLVLGIVLGAAVVIARRRQAEAQAPAARPTVGRILLPFTGRSISVRALDAALRLAKAEDASLVPVYVATVPLTLPADAPIPEQADVALAMLEAIEQRACEAGVVVDSRIERGRTVRDGLRKVMAEERFERMLIPVSNMSETGLTGEDVSWLLEHAPTEVVAFRAAPDAEQLAANGLSLGQVSQETTIRSQPSALRASSSSVAAGGGSGLRRGPGSWRSESSGAGALVDSSAAQPRIASATSWPRRA